MSVCRSVFLYAFYVTLERVDFKGSNIVKNDSLVLVSELVVIWPYLDYFSTAVNRLRKGCFIIISPTILFYIFFAWSYYLYPFTLFEQ